MCCCDLSSSRSTTDPTIALGCGHQYCLEYLAELCRSDWARGAAPSCCSISLSTDALHQLQELQDAATTKPVAARTKSAASMIAIDDDGQSGVGDHIDAQSSQRRRQSKHLLFGKAKAKKPKSIANEIDLVGSPELISTAGKRPHTEYAEAEEAAEEQRTRCFTCKRMVLTSEAACGHGFCLQCLGNRCRQAVKNGKDGGIGFPLRCCDQVLPLKVVRPALSAPLYTQYKALVAKREDDMKQLTKQKCGTSKQKAKPKAASKAQAQALSLIAAITPSKPAPAKRLRLGGSTAPTVAEAQKEQDEPVIVEIADHFECVACMEQLSEKAQRFRGPCGHVYCAECLDLMAKKALEDRLLVPVRCCSKELPVEYIARVLSRRDLGTYNHFLKDSQTDSVHS